MKTKTVLELCAGGGGQFLGLEKAGFNCVAAVEIEKDYCKTLIYNRPDLNVINADIKELDSEAFANVDLIAGGVPCQPYSIAGKQHGKKDERDLFPTALKIIKKSNPKAVLLENVKGLSTSKFQNYRTQIKKELEKLGYVCKWEILNASDFGVPQLRPRFILVATKKELDEFVWPKKIQSTKTVGCTLQDLMIENGWSGAKNWAKKADSIAPTIVGGSKKHGGADLGPTRARQKWKELGVNGSSLADSAPDKFFPEEELPRLTIRMAARIQGFPDSWKFPTKKTSSYRQIGNAFPPPVAFAIGKQLMKII